VKNGIINEVAKDVFTKYQVVAIAFEITITARV